MKEPFTPSKIIRADQVVTQWLPPSMRAAHEPEPEMVDADSDSSQAVSPITAAQLEELQAQAQAEGYEQGRQEGFEYGHREGIEAGRSEMRERLAQFDDLLAALDEPFRELDDQVENEVVTLIIGMVRQLVRREVRMDPGHIVGVVREALAILPVNSRGVRVLLHPEDAVLVREAYSLGDSEQKWQPVDDPVIQRGGCRVVTATSQIDATLESRLNSLIAPLLGSERQRSARVE